MLSCSMIFSPDECPDLCWLPFSEENWKKASFPVFFYTIMVFNILKSSCSCISFHTSTNYGRTRRLINIFTYSIRIHNLVNVSVRKSPQKLINSSMHKESKNQDTQSHQTYGYFKWTSRKPWIQQLSFSLIIQRSSIWFSHFVFSRLKTLYSFS